MNSTLIVLTFVLLLLVIIYHSSYVTEYFQIGRKADKTLLLYFQPWCGYCKNFMPVWDQLKQYRSTYNLDMQAINCEEHPMLCERDNITGYPTLRLVSGNKIIEYQGDRSLNDLLKFISY